MTVRGDAMDDRAEPAAKPDPHGPPPGWPAAVRHLRERLADMLLVCDAVLYRASPPAGLLEALRGGTWRLEQALRQCRQDLPTGREGRTSDPGAEGAGAD
jgi:hypothetical protein